MFFSPIPIFITLSFAPCRFYYSVSSFVSPKCGRKNGVRNVIVVLQIYVESLSRFPKCINKYFRYSRIFFFFQINLEYKPCIVVFQNSICSHALQKFSMLVQCMYVHSVVTSNTCKLGVASFTAYIIKIDIIIWPDCSS